MVSPLVSRIWVKNSASRSGRASITWTPGRLLRAASPAVWSLWPCEWTTSSGSAGPSGRGWCRRSTSSTASATFAPGAPVSIRSACLEPSRRYRNGFSKFVQPDCRRMMKVELYSCTRNGGAFSQSGVSAVHRAGNTPRSKLEWLIVF